MTAIRLPVCDLCDGDGGSLLFRGERWRVVRVTGAEGDAYPGYCRVIWNAHVRELTDLAEQDREQFMAAVFLVEKALRDCLSPWKMNVASLGNLTPHLHWHIIPRYENDPAFPRPVWAIDLTSISLDTLATKHRRGIGDEAWERVVRRALESARI